MMIENARYAAVDNSTIVATVDGVEMTVPNDQANRHRKSIADWEADGNSIAPFVPSTDGLTVNGERDRRVASGFTASVSAGSDVFPVDTRNLDDWANIQGLVTYAQVLLATSPTTSINFRDADNVVQTLTPGEMIEVGLQALAHKQGHYDAAWTLKSTEGGVPADFAEDQYWPSPS